ATGTSEKTGEALDRVADAVQAMGDLMIRVADRPIGTFIGRLGELDAMARRVLSVMQALSLNDEIAGAIGSFIAPERELTEQAVKDFAARNGIGPQSGRTPTTGRLTAPVETVSLSDFAPPSGGAGGGGRGGGGGRSSADRFQ